MGVTVPGPRGCRCGAQHPDTAHERAAVRAAAAHPVHGAARPGRRRRGGTRAEGDPEGAEDVALPQHVLGRERGLGPETGPKSVTTSDCKHQSAPDQHGYQVEYGTRCVLGGVELRNARIMVKNNVEVGVPKDRGGEIVVTRPNASSKATRGSQAASWHATRTTERGLPSPHPPRGDPAGPARRTGGRNRAGQKHEGKGGWGPGCAPEMRGHQGVRGKLHKVAIVRRDAGVAAPSGVYKNVGGWTGVSMGQRACVGAEGRALHVFPLPPLPVVLLRAGYRERGGLPEEGRCVGQGGRAGGRAPCGGEAGHARRGRGT